MSILPRKTLHLIWLLLFLLSIGSCHQQASSRRSTADALPAHRIQKPLPPNASPQLKKLIDGALAQAGVTTGYDPSYVKLDYPNGDVPIETGVCSDVIVRAFRKAGIDLQKEVHEDMQAMRSAYPTKWGAGFIDSNIDHRRVLNLMTFFDRRGKSVAITSTPDDYLPGDIVSWDLGGGIDHIGVVSDL